MELVAECDKQELALGDVLDVKAGILFGMIAILCAISSVLLTDPHLAKGLQIAQAISLVVAAIAAACTFWVLIPRTYHLPSRPAALKEWFRNTLERSEPGNEEWMISEGLTLGMSERIEANRVVNSTKSQWMIYAFWTAMAALLIDLVTLGIVAWSKFLF